MSPPGSERRQGLVIGHPKKKAAPSGAAERRSRRSREGSFFSEAVLFRGEERAPNATADPRAGARPGAAGARTRGLAPRAQAERRRTLCPQGPKEGSTRAPVRPSEAGAGTRRPVRGPASANRDRISAGSGSGSPAPPAPAPAPRLRGGPAAYRSGTARTPRARAPQGATERPRAGRAGRTATARGNAPGRPPAGGARPRRGTARTRPLPHAARPSPAGDRFRDRK